MNILSFDIEEWAIAKTKGIGCAQKYSEYDQYLNRILDLLDERGIKATFFCTGMMATDFPYVVRLIKERGHEIGCHSFHHTWMNKLSETEARQDTRSAVDSLEQCIGQKVYCYRAPAFTIGESNKYLIEVLVENGITCDASIYPAARDFGGFKGFKSKNPCIIEYNGIHIKEFPICTTTIFGKDVAYSGGGYFRFFPLSFIKKTIGSSSYSMCYFHIGDLIPDSTGLQTKEAYEAYYREKGTIINRYKRYLKANLGKSDAFHKMEMLIKQVSFESIEQAVQSINWSKTPVVTL